MISTISSTPGNESEDVMKLRCTLIGNKIIEVLGQKMCRAETSRVCSPYVVLRILEFWLLETGQDSMPLMYEALLEIAERSHSGLPKNTVVELYIASPSPGVCLQKYNVPRSAEKWLKIRKVYLPNPNFMMSASFDIIALWANHGGNIWSSAEDACKEISTICSDSALLLYLGEADGSQNTSQSSFKNTWSVGKYLKKMRFVHIEDLGKGISCAKMRPDLETNHRCQDSMLIAADAQQAKNFYKTWEYDTNLCSIREIVISNDAMDSAEEIDGIKQELHSLFNHHIEREKIIVNIFGMYDDSDYALNSFVSTIMIMGIIDEVASSYAMPDKSVVFWTVASNVFSSPIDVHKASLVTMASLKVISAYPKLTGKFVDIDNSVENLRLLTRLLNFSPHQDFFLVSEERVWMAIYRDAGVDIPRRIRVDASDSDLRYSFELQVGSNRRKCDFYASKIGHLQPEDLVIDIEAAALNFRDVMLSLDALPKISFENSFYGHAFGMEAVGIVSKVSEISKNDFEVGDKVIIADPGCIASKLVVNYKKAVKLPKDIDSIHAASFQSVYLTAYYALVYLCRIRRNEKVLIHAGAGGVGHAALSICRHFGAEVFMTASSAKRRHLESLGVPSDHIFDSRSTSWYRGLMKASNGGIDIVLNSLAGDHQVLGIQALRPCGRFCEIGKVDIYSNNQLSLLCLAKNISFHVIDMDGMQIQNTDLVEVLLSKVVEHLLRGDFKPIPATCSPMNEIQKVLNLMKSGHHIGKCVLKNFQEDGTPVQIDAIPKLELDPNSFILIAGATGGYGRKIIDWAWEHGARRFAVIVRQDPQKVEDIFDRIISQGAIIKVLKLNFSSTEALCHLKEFCNQLDGKVTFIVHSVGEFIPNSTISSGWKAENLAVMANVKNRAALLLHELSIHLQTVEFFYIVGSSGFLDGPFVSNWAYDATNAMLDALARKRIECNLPCTILSMTSLQDVGIISNDLDAMRFQQAWGISTTTSHEVLKIVGRMITNSIPSCTQSQEFGDLVSFMHRGSHLESRQKVYGDIKDSEIRDFSTTEHIELAILDKLTEILGESVIDPHTALVDLGMDSLSFLEFYQYIQKEFRGFNIDRTFYSKNVSDLAEQIHVYLLPQTKEEADELAENAVGTSREPRVLVEEENKVSLDIKYEGCEASFLVRYRNVGDATTLLLVFPGVGSIFPTPTLPKTQTIFVNTRVLKCDIVTVASKICSELYKSRFLDGTMFQKVILLGYSFGSLISLEVARQMVQKYCFQPACIIAVASCPPHKRKNIKGNTALVKILSAIPNKKVVQHLVAARLKSTNKDIFRRLLLDAGISNTDDISDILSHVFTEIEIYRRHVRRVQRKNRKSPYIQADIPIYHCQGTSDDIFGTSTVKDWKCYTNGKTSTYTFHGNHLFPFDDLLRNSFALCLETLVRRYGDPILDGCYT